MYVFLKTGLEIWEEIFEDSNYFKWSFTSDSKTLANSVGSTLWIMAEHKHSIFALSTIETEMKD